MDNNTNFTRNAFFLLAKSGKLFCLHYIPHKNCIAHIILFPPFAEELNRSRHLITLMASQFAEQGYSVLVADLYGTGDSEGDFIDARWDIWKQDMLDVIAYAQKIEHLPINFLTIRLGTLLALDIINNPPELSSANMKIDHLIAWQPVFDSSRFIQQFLRISLASNINENSKITSPNIKNKIYKNNSLEIGGYNFSSKLMDDILSISFLDKNLSAINKLSLIQIITGSSTSLSMDIQSFMLKPEIKDNTHFKDHVTIQLVSGPYFWQNYEVKDIEELRKVTLSELFSHTKE